MPVRQQRLTCFYVFIFRGGFSLLDWFSKGRKGGLYLHFFPKKCFRKKREDGLEGPVVSQPVSQLPIPDRSMENNHVGVIAPLPGRGTRLISITMV